MKQLSYNLGLVTKNRPTPKDTRCRRPLATTRLYFRVEQLAADIPTSLGLTRLASSQQSPALPGEAASPHAKWPYYFEVGQRDFSGAHFELQSFVTAIRLCSDTHIRCGPYAIVDEMTGPHVLEQPPTLTPSAWGHYDDTLQVEALKFAARFGPRLAQLSGNQSFNRLSNALRLYTHALDLIPSDVALVAFMTALEGLFSAATQELSFRLALAVAWFLEPELQQRRVVFDEVRDLYITRSKIVHGDRISRDEEQASILLAEDLVPRSERIVRRCIRKMLEEGMDTFIETTKDLDHFFRLMALGYTAAEARIMVERRG